jgi:hypothetical protein
MTGRMMPAYPRPTARGLRPLVNRADKLPKVNQITDLPDSYWKGIVQTVMSSGCGLLLSPTSDGGALSVTLYFGDERAKDYASSSDELEAVLSAAADQAQAYELSSTKHTVPKGPGAS